MPAGRPLKFGSLEELQHAIDAYFAECAETNTPYTITGLAIALKTCRQTLLNYEVLPEFLDTIKEAKLRVENYSEVRLHTAASPTGPIFALKNFGWSDRIETDNTHKGTDGGPIQTSLTVSFVSARDQKSGD